MAVSGMESMFRAMGLGQVLDMAKAMAENGTFDKILKFADEAEALRQSVQELIAEVRAMKHENELRSIRRLDIPSSTETDPGPADFDGLTKHDIECLGTNRAAE